MNRIRRVLFAGHDTPGSFYLLREILSRYPDIEWALLLTEGIYYRRTFLESVMKLLRESSVIFCSARAVEVWGYKLRGDTISKYCKTKNKPYQRTWDVNDDGSLQFARSFKPDLLVSLYTMHLYKRPILSIPALGAIGSHPSILPNYRGLEVFFWAMANGEAEIGSSVFFLGERVDDGLVIREQLLSLPASYSMSDTYWLITRAAADLICKAMVDIDTNQLRLRQPEGKGSYFPMPTREAVRRFRARGKRFF